MRFSTLYASAAAFALAGALLPNCGNAQNAAAGDLPVVAANLSLQDALKLADRDNVTLMQAQANSDSASASADHAKAALRPSVSATADAVNGDMSRILGSSPGVAPPSIYNVPSGPFVEQNRLKIMIPLFTGGLLQKNREASELQASAQRSDANAQRLSVQEHVVESYVKVLLDKALLVAQQSRLAYEQEQLRITQQKVNTGALAPVDLLREEAARDDAQSAIAQAQAHIDIALVDLKSSLGVTQTSNLTLTETLNSLEIGGADTPPGSLDDAIRIASGNRPELAAAKQRLNAAQAQIRAAQAEYAPQIYGVGVASAAMAQQNMSGKGGYTIGLTASIPLYDGGARTADVNRAKAARASAQAEMRAARQNIESNVAVAWYALQAVQPQVSSAQAGVLAAQKAYDLATLRYNAGKSTTADRLDSLDALTHAQTGLAQALAAQVDAKSSLITALGANL